MLSKLSKLEGSLLLIKFIAQRGIKHCSDPLYPLLPTSEITPINCVAHLAFNMIQLGFTCLHVQDLHSPLNFHLKLQNVSPPKMTLVSNGAINMICFGGISGEFCRAMVRILAKRSRAKIPMARSNEPASLICRRSIPKRYD